MQLGQLGEVSDDVLADAVGKILCSLSPLMLLNASTAMEVLSGTGWRGSDRRANRQCEPMLLDDNAEYLDRPHDVLDGMIAAILDADRYLVAHMVGG